MVLRSNNRDSIIFNIKFIVFSVLAVMVIFLHLVDCIILSIVLSLVSEVLFERLVLNLVNFTIGAGFTTIVIN